MLTGCQPSAQNDAWQREKQGRKRGDLSTSVGDLTQVPDVHVHRHVRLLHTSAVRALTESAPRRANKTELGVRE